jgi:Transglycosylase SLT domain
MGIVLPVGVVAAIVVAGVSVAAYLAAPGRGSGGADGTFMAIQNSNTLALLENERQQLIDMNAAAHTLTVAAKPKVVSPSQVVASSSPTASAGTGTGTGTGNNEPTAAIPSAGTAESIGYNMLPSFGFSQSTQWGCLYNLWMRESGWVVDAQNPSGAYGIPQAYPASQMASAGSDYLTNPTTQIKWGLGYIKGRYGTPCAAWNFELANNFY